ncbi:MULTISPECIES: hypothetical protein [unclassified Flavobacterium]|uniref:hypothetical protein n=1 Tax=unclassified Flavobacterium TaxID=196869 RepID=UPI001F12CFC8|nr:MULTISPECIES: hypothetical protein [unclassified Flavobacterium]UMY67122.1 hypothetical protein MKO97_07015 [Flavobacterium sp. HJ-32-4]
MTSRQKFKYLVLIVLPLFAMAQVVHNGDFCTSIADALFLSLILILFILFFIVITLRDIYKLIRFRTRFDFRPALIFVAAGALVWMATENEVRPLFKKEVYVGRLDTSDTNAGLSLYSDGTFTIWDSSIESQCFVKGDYEITGAILTLHRDQLPPLTDQMLTNVYRIGKDSCLIPLKTPFLRLVPTSHNR